MPISEIPTLPSPSHILGNVMMLPSCSNSYKKRLKAEPVTIRSVKMWSDSAMTELQGNVEATNFKSFWKIQTTNRKWTALI